MKRKLLFTLFALLTISSAAWAAIGDSWEVTQGDGKIKYTVITEPSVGNNGTVSISKGSTTPTGALSIPATVTNGGKTYTVTDIAASAFQYCSGLTSASIPDSVKEIGLRAFYECKDLKSVSIGDGVMDIYIYTFTRCTSLESVSIGSGVETIYNNAFYGCTNLKSITIPDNVKTIDNGVFQDCTNLESVSIGSGVTSIDFNAFEGCALTSVTIPDNVETIGSTVFKDCTGLESITVGAGNKNYSSDANGVLYDKDQKELIQYPLGNKRNTFSIPNGVETIAQYAFEGCTILKSVSIPNSVETIGDYAFRGCSGLTSVTIPDDVETIGSNAFDGCSGLKSVSIGSGLTSINNKVFNGCASLTSVTIPDGVETIGSNAFDSCTGLESVRIGNGVETINSFAFLNCTNLKSVSIGSSVTKIVNQAFNGCASLTSIICMPTNPPSLGLSVFAGTFALTSIYVPRESLDEYKNEWEGKGIFYANAEFKSLTYAVSAKANAGGSASASPSGTDVLLNTAVTFTATADSGYEFEKWTDDNNADATVSTDAVYVVEKLDSDMALTAHFTLVDPAILLEQAKQEINKIIDDMLDEYNEDDYRPEQWEDLKDIFEEAKKEVNEMTSFEELEYVDLESLKTKADSIPTDNEMTTAELNAFNKAKADLQASITAAENKQKEAGYEDKYTDETRKSVADALYNAKKTLEEHGNSTDIVTATTEMKSAIHSLDTAIERLKENPTVGIDSVEGSEPFTRDGNTIRFAQPTQIAVYSTSGQIIYTGKTEEYTLPQASGIYILRTANGSWKLAKQ